MVKLSIDKNNEKSESKKTSTFDFGKLLILFLPFIRKSVE